MERILPPGMDTRFLGLLREQVGISGASADGARREAHRRVWQREALAGGVRAGSRGFESDSIECSNVTSHYPAVEVITPQEAARRWKRGALPSFDAVATFSSVEHAGLGRNGDQLNPWGDIMALGRHGVSASPAPYSGSGCPSPAKIAWTGIQGGNMGLSCSRTLSPLAAG